MFIELTIKVDYLSSWGSYEGLRELLQNGRDAEVEFDAPLSVRYRKDSRTVVIENDGCTLPYEALLLGHTSKSDRPDLIGKFGEGLKLGILALVRQGMPVKIRSGGEVWTPMIRRSEKFRADVLAFEIEKGRKEQRRVSIEVGNIDETEWAQMQDCFLFLGTVKETEVIKTPNGSLLLGDRFSGRVYVKGIFVSKDPRLSYGYDLVDAEIDRDRKMVAKYDLQYRTSTIWREALVRRADLCDSFTKLLEREAADVEGIEDWGARYLPEDVKKAVADSFLERHGDDAIPVATLGDSQDVDHLGKKGIVVPKPLRHVLEQRLGTIESNKAKLREEATTHYGWHDLSAEEKANIERALFLVNGVEPVSIDEVDIVDFRDEKIVGMFRSDSRRVLIAKKIVSDRDMTLETLIHEVAHRKGGDGEHSHVESIERIWSGIVARLTRGDVK
jgi:hypothetical protein